MQVLSPLVHISIVKLAFKTNYKGSTYLLQYLSIQQRVDTYITGLCFG